MKSSSYHLILSIVCAIASAVFLYLGTTDTSTFCFILTVYNGLKSDIYEIEEKLKSEEDANPS
jgi:hypothetical protein